jgi:hypothetical protein
LMTCGSTTSSSSACATFEVCQEWPNAF